MDRQPRHLAHRLISVRDIIPLLAALFVALAAIVDPAQWWRVAVLAVPVVLFGCWHRWPALLLPLAVVVPVALCVAQWDGQLEISLFLASLLALTAAAWESNRVLAWLTVLGCVLTPPVLGLFGPDTQIDWPIWVCGIILPAVLGASIRQLERVTAELVTARRELAERAVADERRRIARDVHDLVGHGLATIMLQVTSARHVLRRDPDSADEALCSAEEVGRRSLQELRGAVGLLRRDDDRADNALPSITLVASLVDAFSAAGLDVGYREVGDLSVVDPSIGLTLYRIAQESLANAARHAPQASTTVVVTVDDRVATIEIASVGPVVGMVGNRGHYGLVGMQERARIVGGQVWSGRSSVGWSTRCSIPLGEPAAGVGGGGAPAAVMDS